MSTDVVREDDLPPFLRKTRSQNGVAKTPRKEPTMNHTFELLPIIIEVRGEVISSNAAEFMTMIREALSHINRSPSTDEEFGQAKQDISKLEDAEKSIVEAKEKALADAAELQAVFATLDDAKEEIRQARLELEKAIKTRTEELKAELLEKALAVFAEEGFPQGTEHHRAAVKSAMSGKRTVKSMVEAMNVTALTALGQMKKCRAAIDEFEAAHGPDMTRDRDELELKTPDFVTVELKRRIDLRDAEAAKKAAQEEAAKARAEADAAKNDLSHAGTGTATPAPREGAGEPASAPPTGDWGRHAQGEWDIFIQRIKAAFLPVREAKEKLTHTENKERAARLGAAFAEAMKKA